MNSTPGERCEKCRAAVDGEHTQVTCLQTQLETMTNERDKWKEAWWRQRDATGLVAWWPR